MVASQNYVIHFEVSCAGGRTNEIGERLRCLSGIAPMLIYLTGRRFHTKDRFILNRLVDGCFDNRGVSRADRVHATSPRLAVALDRLLQFLAGALFVLCSGFHDGNLHLGYLIISFIFVLFHNMLFLQVKGRRMAPETWDTVEARITAPRKQ